MFSSTPDKSSPDNREYADPMAKTRFKAASYFLLGFTPPRKQTGIGNKIGLVEETAKTLELCQGRSRTIDLIGP